MLASSTTNPRFSIWFSLPVHWPLVFVFVIDSLTEVAIFPLLVPKTTRVAKHDVHPGLLRFSPERSGGRMAEIADPSISRRRFHRRFHASFKVAVALFHRGRIPLSFERGIGGPIVHVCGSNIHLRQARYAVSDFHRSRVRTSLVRAARDLRFMLTVSCTSGLVAGPRPWLHPTSVPTPPWILSTYLSPPSASFLAPSTIVGSAAGAIPST